MSTSMIFLIVVFCLGACPSSTRARNIEDYEIGLDEVERYRRAIAPGTKWCGNGDRASHDDDLGYFSETDACCREHDKCPSSIPGRESKHGLTNPDRSTRSHCQCDKKFYDCLAKSSSRLSRIIGKLYFKVLRKKCFHEKKCPEGTTCEPEYEWGDGRSYEPEADFTIDPRKDFTS